MVARCLVTTALEATWPTQDKPVLFLGEWCRVYSRKSIWQKRDAVVAPYHWDDRKKLHMDYLYLDALYEQLLTDLAAQLNKLHRVDHSLRYWRILVGPWLGYFVQVVFDRWAMLRKVIQSNEISTVRVCQHREGSWVPNDMETFASDLGTDAWNDSIYGQILDWMKVPTEKIQQVNERNLATNIKLCLSHQLKRYLAQVAVKLSSSISRDNEYFFLSSYLGTKQDFLLQVKLGQLPKFWQSIPTPINAYRSADREWHLPDLAVSDEFSSLVRELIPLNIPLAYMEGYSALVCLTKQLPWPKNPKMIFTSNSYGFDDVFKAWAASQTEIGTPLVVGQHGGNFGVALWSFWETHQISIADRFLTWGWYGNENNKNITPIGNLKGFVRSVRPSLDGFALLVGMAMPRQSHHMYSVPVASGQMASYSEDQYRFVQALPDEMRKNILVRLYLHDYQHDQKQRWKDQFSNIKLDDGRQPMSTLIKKTKVFISTYNSTTYLESLSLNFPTVMFWNPRHWELRDSARLYFEELKSVGIFHETPESAAQHLTSVWSDVEGWWSSPDVQAARVKFCARYSHIPKRPLDVISNLFKSIVKENVAPRFRHLG